MIMNSPSNDHVTRIYSVPRLSVGNDTKPSVEYGALTKTTIDHLVEQMIPVSMWGTKFVTISTPGRDIGDYFRIIASEDSTTISVPGVLSRQKLEV
jgi:hypothetical protein